MGYSTPNIDRLANGRHRLHRLLRAAELYRRSLGLHHGAESAAHGTHQGRLPRREGRHQRRGPDDRRTAQAAWLRDCAVRQEPSGRPDEHLPTNHGFDEFFGNLYHLNAEEEPEHPDYPKDPAFRERFGPRGVIHSWAMPDGTQKIEDTGPLTKKRMETIDDEVTARTLEYLEEAAAGDKPFFVWWNATRMHFRTHIKDETPRAQRAGRVQRRHGRARQPRGHDPRQAG